MEEKVDLENLTKDDFMEMAKYISYLENQKETLTNELRDTKAYLVAIIQQRNSAMNKLKDLLENGKRTMEVGVINTHTDLINPEQWAVPADRVSTTPKSNKI